MRVQEQSQPKRARTHTAIGGLLRDETGVAYLSRGSIFPLLRMRSAAFAPPPARAVVSFASRSATSWSMAPARARNSGEEGETREGRTEAGWYDRAAAATGSDRVARLDTHDVVVARRR